MKNYMILNDKNIGVSEIECDFDGNLRVFDKSHKYSLVVCLAYNKEDINSIKIGESESIDYNEYYISENNESALIWPTNTSTERISDTLYSLYFEFNNISNNVCYMNKRGYFDIELNSLKCKIYIDKKRCIHEDN